MKNSNLILPTAMLAMLALGIAFGIACFHYGLSFGKLDIYEKHISPDRAYSLCIENVSMEGMK